jgi:uncharacterized metal-binding protein
MTEETSCACGAAPKLVFACSGASDVGEIADHAARKLAADGLGKMYCLMGVGGRVSGVVATTQSAGRILAIDGCPLDCARKTLEEAGFAEFDHVRVTDLGMAKGQSPVTDERVETVVLEGASALLK